MHQAPTITITNINTPAADLIQGINELNLRYDTELKLLVKKWCDTEVLGINITPYNIHRIEDEIYYSCQEAYRSVGIRFKGDSGEIYLYDKNNR